MEVDDGWEGGEAKKICLRPAFRYASSTGEGEELGAHEDQSFVPTVDRADLQAALEGLSERERVLISLRYMEDLTQPAIAARLGIPEGTVKVQLHRARMKLRRTYVP